MKKIGLAEICMKSQENLKEFLKAELTERGYSPISEDGFVFAEGDIPVMLTAHMDTVHKDDCSVVCTSPDGVYWMSPQGIGGDDRCGIYAIMKLIETHKCSVLFTEDEETGCVGARKYTKYIKENPDNNVTPKNLKYIIEIDRKNADDAVFYDCENDDFEKFITTDTGFKTAHGSCSDISHIAPALGVAAVNLSSAYYNPHQLCEYINLAELHENIRRIKAIIDKPCEKFEYIEKTKTSYWSNYTGYDYSDYYDRHSGFNSGSTSKSYVWDDFDENYIIEDFMMDFAPEIDVEDLLKEMVPLSQYCYYQIHNEDENIDYEFKPERGDEERFFIDEDFNIYEYDSDTRVMVSCHCVVKSRKFGEHQRATEPYFNDSFAKWYYVIPEDLYADYFNYCIENKEFYDSYYGDDTPEDDNDKKDDLEDDILKLYN